MPEPTIDRRAFLAATAAVPLLPATLATARSPLAAGGPVAISSGNGMRAVEEAMKLLREGRDPADAVVAGVTIVEVDPKTRSVGYGGLPNADGVVQLDASVMHGPTHKAGAVGALENIRTPAKVALEVMRRTDHVMLVGQGALDFAVALGFPQQETLTKEAREAWLRWKSNLSPRDDWLDQDQQLDPDAGARRNEPVPFTWGTIHCAAIDANGDVAATTTTSGLSYKIPGRVGDSPIIGAGMFVDNEVGAAGATGRGESCIQSCASFQVVRNMESGMEPTEACLAALRWIASRTKRRDLLRDNGQPNFNVALYALRKDGQHGSAVIHPRDTYTVHDGETAKRVDCVALYG